MRRLFLASAALAGLLAPAVSALAAPNLITNGDFEQTTMTTASQIGYATTTTASNGTQTTNPNTVNGWTNTNSGYNFIFFANNPTSTGVYGNVSLYTSGNGGSGTNATLNSPTGGNIVAADGAFGTSAITQTINNLTVGTNYKLTFYWAAAQQTGFTGDTTEAWKVTFGNQTQSTATVTNPSKGFTGWMLQTMVFQATSVTQTLSFLAAGTPSGQPPFSLLDGVSMVDAPEPSTLAILAAGIGVLAIVSTAYRRRNSGAFG